MNPSNFAEPEQKPEERERVAPPVFTPPKIVAPDSMVVPGAEKVATAHPEADVRGTLHPTLVTSEPRDDYDDEDEEPVSEAAPPTAAAPVATPALAGVHAHAPASQAGIKPRSKTLLVAAAYVAAAVLSTTLTFTVLKAVFGSRVSTATEFVQDIQAGKTDDAYALTSSKFKDTTTQDVFQEYAEQENLLLPKGTPKLASKTSETVGGTEVTTVALNIKGGTTAGDYHAVIRLTKENGHWLVYSSDIKSGLYSDPLSTSN